MKPTNPRNNTLDNARSALIAGGIAFVIYLFITSLINGFNSSVLLTSLLIGVATFVVTFIITIIISALMRQRKGG